MKIPELEERIGAHAAALVGGDTGEARAFSSDDSVAVDCKGPFVSYERLALAKIGAQFMSKIRLYRADASITLLVRWRKDSSGKWMIAEAEDISSKRSPWSDIPHYASDRGGASNA